MPRLYLDTETYQPDRERDLRRVGGYRYLETAQVILFPWAIGDEPVRLVDLTNGEALPQRLLNALADPTVEVWAHNAQFDRLAVNGLLRRLGRPEVPVERWRDSMVQALTCGFPGGLEQVGECLGLPQDQAKMKDGRKLVLRFTKPDRNGRRIGREQDPDGWRRFCQYAVRDVEAMRRVIQELPPWVYPGNPRELALWHLDQRINDRGLPIDLTLAGQAVELVERHGLALNMAALEIADPHGWAEVPEGGEPPRRILQQRDALLEWIRAQGVQIEGLTKAAVADALRRKDLPEEVRAILELRKASAKASTAKYKAVLRSTGLGARLRGTLQFYGASRTGRFAGRIFQPQNLPSRGLLDADTCVNAILNGSADLLFDDLLLVASSAIRGLIRAPEGRKIVYGDLSGIEARVLPWLAHEEKVLEVFRQGRDIYVETAALILGKATGEVTDWERTVYGKVPVLALGYQGGVGAFVNMAEGYGLEGLDEKFVKGIVSGFRLRHPRIVKLWYGSERAAWEALEEPGRVTRAGRLAFQVRAHRGRSWLTMELPSGRLLMYPRPEVEEVRGRFGPRAQLCYDGVNQYTRKWERIATYSGKLVENATQGAARDVMGYRMLDAEKAGYGIILTVHDELVAEAPDAPEFSGKGLAEIMTRGHAWTGGLPLAAKGKEAARYQK